MKKLFTILFSLMAAVTFGQAPAIQWQKCLGGTGMESSNSFWQTTDGGYIIAGLSSSNDGNVTGNHGSEDYWIAKVNNTGSLQWQKSLGGSGQDIAYAIQQTTDGGYIIAGHSSSNNGNVTGNHGGDDYWVVKLDDTGSLRWQKSLGGSDQDIAYAIQQTADGGYIVAGLSSSNDGDVTGKHSAAIVRDFWVVKLNDTGSIQWQKCLGGTGSDAAYAIQQTRDGGYIVAGESNSTDGDVTGYHNNGFYTNDFWIVKITNTGVIQWQNCFGGFSYEKPSSVQQTTDGGFIIAGFSVYNGGDVTGNHGNGTSDSWIVKVDSIGTLQWQKCLGGTGAEYASSVQQTTDGGYIVASVTNSNDGDVSGNHRSSSNSNSKDLWVVKLNNVGSIQWQKCLGGTGDEYTSYAQQTTDGGYIVASTSISFNGDVAGNHGGTDYWVVKLVGTPVTVSSSSLPEVGFVYPNPATTEINVRSSNLIHSITVSDLSGKVIYHIEELTAPEAKVPTATLPNGFYLIRAVTGNGVINDKFQVQH